jgi:hypothetical protein
LVIWNVGLKDLPAIVGFEVLIGPLVGQEVGAKVGGICAA